MYSQFGPFAGVLILLAFACEFWKLATGSGSGKGQGHAAF